MFVHLLVGSTGHTLLELHHVPGTRKDVDAVLLVLEAVLHLNLQLDVVDSREVQRAGWRDALGHLGVEGEAHVVDEELRDVAVTLVGNDGAPVLATLLAEPRRRVEEELHVLDGVAAVDA